MPPKKNLNFFPHLYQNNNRVAAQNQPQAPALHNLNNPAVVGPLNARIGAIMNNAAATAAPKKRMSQEESDRLRRQLLRDAPTKETI